MAGALVLSGISYLNVDVNAAGKVALSSKKVTVTIGKTKVLKLKNNKMKVVWTVTSGKGKIALKNEKKTSVTILGKKKGNAKVQAKVGKKKYVCIVSVKKDSNLKPKVTPTIKPIATSSATPSITPAVIPSTTPTATSDVIPTTAPTKNPIIKNEAEAAV